MFWADTEGPARIVEGLEKHGFTVAASLRAKAGPARPATASRA
jgi:hypothetical protein